MIYTHLITHVRISPLPDECSLAIVTESPSPSVSPLFSVSVSCVSYRLVAQSIIPGILHGDQQSRLMYGSVEPGARLKVTLLAQTTKSISSRQVLKEEGWGEASVTQPSQVTSPHVITPTASTTRPWPSPDCSPPLSLCVLWCVRRRRRCSRCWRTCARCCCSPSDPCRHAPSPPRTR